MSTECTTIVWKRDFGSSNRKLVAARLADHADDEGRGIWPSVERTAAQTNTSQRTVQRILADFVDEGLLIVVDEGGRGRGSTRRYDFDMNRLRALPEVRWGLDAAETKGDTVSPLENGKGDSGDAKGDKAASKGCHRDTQTVTEPPIEPSPEREGARADGQEGEPETAAPDDRPRQSAEQQARRFWKLARNHPQSSGMPKHRWLDEWMKLTPDEQERAERRYPAWLALLKAQSKSHVPALSTYFAQRLFDEVEDPVAEPERDIDAPAFGPLWNAVRMRALLAGPGPLPRASSFLEQLMAEDSERGAAERLAHQARWGWPTVNGMHAGAENRRGIRVAPHLEALKEAMEPVPVGSECWEAWRAEHELRGWPWIPGPGALGAVWWPKGGPDGLKVFQEAVSAISANGEQSSEALARMEAGEASQEAAE